MEIAIERDYPFFVPNDKNQEDLTSGFDTYIPDKTENNKSERKSSGFKCLPITIKFVGHDSFLGRYKKVLSIIEKMAILTYLTGVKIPLDPSFTSFCMLEKYESCIDHSFDKIKNIEQLRVRTEWNREAWIEYKTNENIITYSCLLMLKKKEKNEY
jgi:hypothetical protein